MLRRPLTVGRGSSQGRSARRTRPCPLSPDVNDPGYREITFDELTEVYAEQADALVDGGADFILIETVFDTLNAKAGVAAVKRVERERGIDLPIMMSMTLTDLSGRNLSGHTVEAFWYSVRHSRPLTIGLNCSLWGRAVAAARRRAVGRRRRARHGLSERRPAQRTGRV